MIDSSESNEASWFISPFYEGQSLAADAGLPASVIKALAAIHAFYASHLDEIDLPHVDADFIQRLLGYVSSTLDKHKERFSESLFDDILREVKATSETSILGDVFQRLPKTLTHSDVHSGNIIHTSAGNYVLFDWGNARIAPGIVDLANMVEIDSPGWHTYLQAWKDITGAALNEDMAHLGYYWGTAIVMIQYLSFAIEFLAPDAAQKMVVKLRGAIDVLQQST